jgi:hypothetical protein
MKIISALVGLTALCGVALSTASASAMPVTVPGQASQASNIIQADYVCNGWGHCWHRPYDSDGYVHPHYYGGWGHRGWGGGYGWHHWHPHYYGGWGNGGGWHHHYHGGWGYGGWHHWHPHYYGGWGYGGGWHHWHQW